MSQDCKQADKGERFDKTTDLGQLPDVFTMSKKVEIHESQDLGTRLLCTSDEWVSAGLNYPIDPKLKTRFTAKMLIARKSDNQVNFGVGFASKNVINSMYSLSSN